MKLCLLAAALLLASCSQTPEPCSPDGITAAKRAAGSGVILAGKCDEHALTDCPALGDAQNVVAAHQLACKAAK